MHIMSRIYNLKKMFIYIYILHITLISVCFFTFEHNVTNYRYDVFNLNLSENEMIDYYIKNGILPMSSNSPVSDRINHFQDRFPEYYSRSKSNSPLHSGYELDVYGSNPCELSQSYPFINQAKDEYINENHMSNFKTVGCGTVALISQFEFLSRSAQYFTISNNLEKPSDIGEYETSEERTFSEESYVIKSYPQNRYKLAKEIIDNIQMYPSEIWNPIFGTSLSGTYVFPSNVIDTANTLLEKYHLAVRKYDGNGENQYYYDDDSQLYAYGDSAINLSSFSTKISNLKDSIDRGMPVIWWTSIDGAGPFSNHYMNIYGYEYWKGIDTEGNEKLHLMFLLKLNWNESEYEIISEDEKIPIYQYVDSEVFNAANGGFIYFEASDDRTVITPSDYGYECQYFYNEKTKYYASEKWGTYTTRYLRAGYVNKYDETNTEFRGQEISLSANRDNAGEAYIQYNKGRPINKIYIELSWWSANEGIDVTNGYVRLETKDYNGNWDVQLDLLDNNEYVLSTDKENKTRIICEFSYPTTSFRLYVRTDEPSGTRNKGRIVVGNLMMFHTPKEHEISYNEYDAYNHQEYCKCGYTNIVPHVIQYSYINDESFPCMICPAIISRNDLLENANIVKRSENYSYLLSNGVIILTDEDIPLYKNGTLVFNDII